MPSINLVNKAELFQTELNMCTAKSFEDMWPLLKYEHFIYWQQSLASGDN